MSETTDSGKKFEDLARPLNETTIPPEITISGKKFEDLARPLYASFAEKAEAAALGAGKGTAETAGFLGPIVAGVRLGSFLPFPGASVLGGVAGLGAGLYLTEVIDRHAPGPLGFGSLPKSNQDSSDPLNIQKQLTPYFEGGRTFGSAFTGAPLAFLFRAGKGPFVGGQGVGKLIDAIGNYARANPSAYLKKEALASFYAGLAGGTAVELAPNSPFARLAAELVAGTLSPGKALFEAKSAVDSAKKSLEKSGTTTEIQNYVSNALAELLEQSGENPQRLANLIRERLKTAPRDPRTGRVLPTTAQLIDSPVLTALDKTLAKGNAKYSADSEAQGIAAFEAYKTLIRELENTGDPALLNAAAQLRNQVQQNNLQSALNLAQLNAAEKVMDLGPRGTENRATVGRIILNEFEDIISVFRQTERQKWSDALRSAYKQDFKPVRLKANNTLEVYLEMAHGPNGFTKTDLNKYFGDVSQEMFSLGYQKSMAAPYKKAVQTPEYFENNTVGPEVIEALNIKSSPAEQLIKLRSSWLNAAREADIAGNNRVAGQYSRLAEATLKDLEKLPGDAYKEARAFSKNFNDVVTRTFAGELDDLTSTGAAKYAPEVLIRRAFAVGSDPAYLRAKQILEAAQNIPGAKGRVNTIRGAQQLMLRSLASETVDSSTGEIRLPAFQSFIDKNQDLIKMLGMQNEFSNVSIAQKALLDLRNPKSPASLQFKDPLYQEEAFARLLDGASPASVINKAMSSDNPTGKLKALFALAQEKGPDEINGLKSAMYQYAFEKAGGASNFKLSEWEKALFIRPKNAPNQPPLYKIMSDAGLLSFGEIKNMRRLLAPMVRIENVLASKQILDPGALPGGPATLQSSAEEMAQAWAAARFAGAVSPGGPGSLSFAGRMIGMSKNIFSQMPTQKRLDLMIEASKDPSLMEGLLRRGVTPQEKREINLGILRRLYPTGVFPTAVERYADTIEPIVEEQPPPAAQLSAPQQTAAKIIRRAVPTVESRGVFKLPVAQTQFPPNPQARDTLRRLFPFDRTLQ
jgi:hypothetical protein